MSLLRAGDVRGLLSRYADLALAGLVVAIVGMMIVPLPTPLLDLLISVNIAAAVTLLLVAIYVSDALKIATFPTLLLLTTLFRLALEVSATRLILLRADAGEVIRAFGNFVVAGNLVVGAVIFLILTMIQFLVVAKGSERVAEVAARFTLDAMPGKQMSIDAELRAGHIDHNEARRRRAALARESQLFGSMDGAMKFVKGDAIAGIVILAVNIVGGLVIGVVQRGMDAGDGRAHLHPAHDRRRAGGADPGAHHLDVRRASSSRGWRRRRRGASSGATSDCRSWRSRRRSPSRPGSWRCWRLFRGCRRCRS